MASLARRRRGNRPETGPRRTSGGKAAFDGSYPLPKRTVRSFALQEAIKGSGRFPRRTEARTPVSVPAGGRRSRRSVSKREGRGKAPVSLKKPSRRPHEHTTSSPDGSKCVKPFSRLQRARHIRRPAGPAQSTSPLSVRRRRMPLLRFEALLYFIMQAEKSKQENAARVDFFFLL